MSGNIADPDSWDVVVNIIIKAHFSGFDLTVSFPGLVLLLPLPLQSLPKTLATTAAGGQKLKGDDPSKSFKGKGDGQGGSEGAERDERGGDAEGPGAEAGGGEEDGSH